LCRCTVQEDELLLWCRCTVQKDGLLWMKSVLLH